MNISENIINKYQIDPLDGLIEAFGDTPYTRIGFYETVLQKTDHIPLKIFENFIEDMATASLAETFVVVINFFKNVKVTYAEVLTARKTAREEINRIEEEMATATE